MKATTVFFAALLCLFSLSMAWAETMPGAADAAQAEPQMTWMNGAEINATRQLETISLAGITGPKCDFSACPRGCKSSYNTCGAGDQCCSVISVGAPCPKCTP